MSNGTEKIPVVINRFETKFRIGDQVILKHDPEKLIYTIGKITVYSDSGYAFDISRGMTNGTAMPSECLGVD